MQARELRKGIEIIASVHWERRLFDALIPLPDGTSYNAYLVHGAERTALIDSTDPELAGELFDGLRQVGRLDLIVSQHAEQDHSGVLPELLARYPEATLLCSPKAESLLVSHLGVPAERLRTVADGERVDLGGKTLQFVSTPWVHWPETMCTYVPEDRCLFSCDFLGSHLATTALIGVDKGRVYEAAKRYYAEIMMPFRSIIQRNLDRIAALDIDLIAPSHGPAYDDPAFIIEAYRDWVSPRLKNEVVVPYISMHGSTARMVRHLVDALAGRGVAVQVFDLAVTDIGKLAMAMVDAATLVVATPTVHLGPHPAVAYAAQLANLLRPKVKYAAVMASYGWSSKAIEQVAGMIPNLKVKVLGTLLQQGQPNAETFAEIDRIAAEIAQAHHDDADVAG
ncbi:MAG: FprA family A-type flavoprotein [Lentisphaerae bacterium]|nr:FprA family A-type flavoprotein [Lentisphaerota bacterium]